MKEKVFPEAVASQSRLKEVLARDNNGQPIYHTKLPDGSVATWSAEKIVGLPVSDQLDVLTEGGNKARALYETHSKYGINNYTSIEPQRVKTVKEVFTELIAKLKEKQAGVDTGDTLTDLHEERRYRKQIASLEHVLDNGERLPSPRIQEQIKKVGGFSSIPCTEIDGRDFEPLSDYQGYKVITNRHYQVLKEVDEANRQPARRLVTELTVKRPSHLSPEDFMIQQVKDAEADAKANGKPLERLAIGVETATKVVELDPGGLQQQDLQRILGVIYNLKDQLEQKAFDPKLTVGAALETIVKERKVKLQSRQESVSPYVEFNQDGQFEASQYRIANFLDRNLDKVNPQLREMPVRKALFVATGSSPLNQFIQSIVQAK